MLFEHYQALADDFPRDHEGLFGVEVEGSADLWLAIDERLQPALLFPALASDVRSDIQFQSIEALFTRKCSIRRDHGKPMVGSFSILKLQENDPDLVRAFLRLLGEVFPSNAGAYTSRKISEKLLEVAALFSRMDHSAKDVIGLWGELWIIAASKNVTEAARCWAVHPDATFDFVTTDFVLEVKTTVSSTRTHRFALDQLRPNEFARIFVASLRICQHHKGKTLGDLVEEIALNINEADVSRAFIEGCLTKGGNDLYKNDTKFSLLQDEATPLYFDAEAIPTPHVSIGSPISRVRFDVNLNGLEQVGERLASRLAQFQTP